MLVLSLGYPTFPFERCEAKESYNHRENGGGPLGWGPLENQAQIQLKNSGYLLGISPHEGLLIHWVYHPKEKHIKIPQKWDGSLIFKILCEIPPSAFFRNNKLLSVDLQWQIDVANRSWRINTLHSPSLTWNLKMMVSKRNLLFLGAIFRWTMLNFGRVFFACSSGPSAGPFGWPVEKHPKIKPVTKSATPGVTEKVSPIVQTNLWYT